MKVKLSLWKEDDELTRWGLQAPDAYFVGSTIEDLIAALDEMSRTGKLERSDIELVLDLHVA